MRIGDIDIRTNLPDMTEAEARRYVDFVRERAKAPIALIEISGNADGTVDVSYEAHWQKFERIRRITGYLTGDLNTWNNAKRSEEIERVKHDD